MEPDLFGGAIRACLFDMDGVLTDTASVHAAAWKSTFDDLLRSLPGGAAQRPFDPLHDYDEFVDGKPRYDGVRDFLASRGIGLPEGSPGDPPDRNTVCGVGNRKDEEFLRLLHAQGVTAYPGSVRLLRAVRRAGLASAVVSSSVNAGEVVARAGIADLLQVRIDGVVAAEEHLAGKPAPDTFWAAARRLGVGFGAAAVFEDALAGVAAGRAGHFGLVVGVARREPPEALRAHGADVVVSDLGELVPQP